MMARFAVGCTLRNWALASTTVDTNPINDITWISLEPRLHALWDKVGVRELGIHEPLSPP